MPQAEQIALSRGEREILKRWARGSNRLAVRARIVLRAADGLSNEEIAAELQVSKNTAGFWRRRVAEDGIAAILEGRYGRG